MYWCNLNPANPHEERENEPNERPIMPVAGEPRCIGRETLAYVVLIEGKLVLILDDGEVGRVSELLLARLPKPLVLTR